MIGNLGNKIHECLGVKSKVEAAETGGKRKRLKRALWEKLPLAEME
jgi:hypothetical protein